MEKEIKKEMRPEPEAKKEPSSQTAPKFDEKRIMAIIAYVVFFIPLLTEAKNDPFVKFHIKQGMILFVAWIAAAIISGIPILGWMLAPILSIAVLVLLVVGIINAYTGKQKPLPLIGKYAEQLKF